MRDRPSADRPLREPPMTSTALRAPGTESFLLSVAGEPRPAASGRTYTSVDPFTGEPWAQVPDAGPEDVDAAVRAARTASDGEWGALTATQRGKLLHRLADLIARDAEKLAEMET